MGRMFQKYLPSLVERIYVGALLTISLIVSGCLPFVSIVVADVACIFDVLGAIAMIYIGRAEARFYDPDNVMLVEVSEYFREGLEKAGPEVNADLGLALLDLTFDCADTSYAHACAYPVFGGVAFLLHFALSLVVGFVAKAREFSN